MTSRVITRPAEEIDAPYVTACEYRGGWDLWVEFNNGASAVVDMSYLKNHPRFPVKHRHFRKPEVTLGSVGWGGEDDGLVISPDDLYIRAGFATSEEMFPDPDTENFAMPKSVKDADNGESIFVEFGDGTAGYLKVTASLFSGAEYPLSENSSNPAASKLAPWGDILWHGTTELCSDCVKEALLAEKNGSLRSVNHVKSCIQT